jgi:UDP-glucose 4-epimerase
MRVLVTGVSGFSGSYLARFLAQAGFDVVGLYRRETVLLSELHAIPELKLIRSDLVEAAALPGPFEAVVHAAATSPGPDISVARIVGDNVGGTFALINAALGWQTRYFLFCSSLSIYGEIRDEVLDENCAIRNPDVYGTTKFLAERRLAELSGTMSGLALRLPGIIGPGARRNWLSGVAVGLRNGATIKAFHLDRPFNNAAHVGDIAALTEAVLRRGWTGFDAIVLGAAGMTTVRGAIERLAVGLGVPGRIETATAAKPSFTLSCRRAVDRYQYNPMDIEAMIDRYAREIARSGTSGDA